jgi:hypothetical protein
MIQYGPDAIAISLSLESAMNKHYDLGHRRLTLDRFKAVTLVKPTTGCYIYSNLKIIITMKEKELWKIT